MTLFQGTLLTRVICHLGILNGCGRGAIPGEPAMSTNQGHAQDRSSVRGTWKLVQDVQACRGGKLGAVGPDGPHSCMYVLQAPGWHWDTVLYACWGAPRQGPRPTPPGASACLCTLGPLTWDPRVLSLSPPPAPSPLALGPGPGCGVRAGLEGWPWLCSSSAASCPLSSSPPLLLSGLLPPPSLL